MISTPVSGMISPARLVSWGVLTSIRFGTGVSVTSNCDAIDAVPRQ